MRKRGLTMRQFSPEWGYPGAAAATRQRTGSPRGACADPAAAGASQSARRCPEAPMLEHLRVLEVAGFGTAICGQILGDLGADVIVVEPPEGDELRRRPPFYQDVPHPDRSLPWWAYNRNKRGITLDLTSTDGQERFRHLAADADFVLEGFGPGDAAGSLSMESLGLGYERLAAENPKLIMVSTSPFGLD